MMTSEKQELSICKNPGSNGWMALRRSTKTMSVSSRNSGGLASCPSFRHWWCSNILHSKSAAFRSGLCVRVRVRVRMCRFVCVWVKFVRIEPKITSAVDSRPPTTYVNTRLVDYTGDVYYPPYAIPNLMPSLPCCHTAVCTCRAISLHLSVESGTGRGVGATHIFLRKTKRI